MCPFACKATGCRLIIVTKDAVECCRNATNFYTNIAMLAHSCKIAYTTVTDETSLVYSNSFQSKEVVMSLVRFNMTDKRLQVGAFNAKGICAIDSRSEKIFHFHRFAGMQI
mmetsp:Transcript_31568/g.53846  ORF Transcript_31568/g.53846 Transcript_31568/m.53846 type:complete len:111 (-) Transcript_31568:799-1131(-)